MNRPTSDSPFDQNTTDQTSTIPFFSKDREPSAPQQIGGQVDLFQYADRIGRGERNLSSQTSRKTAPSDSSAPDKTHYVIDDSAIPELGSSDADTTLPATVSSPPPLAAPFQWSKTHIAIVAITTAIAVMVVSLLSVFLRFYSKVDYVPDDPDAYYRGVKAADIQSASYVTNLLLIGTDERTEAFSDKARADCMMLLSFNSRTDTVSLVSLERGMTVSYLKSDGTYGSDLLTHVFRHGGAGLLIHTIENTFKVKIDGYVRVNFHTFAQIIDRLGGVDITLDADEVRGLNTEKHKGQVIDRPLSVGINHLSGEEALLYARLRWIDSDFQRIQRQRKVIVAVKEKLRDVSAFRLMGIAGDILPLVQTNLSASRMASALFKGSMALGSDTQQMTVPFKGTYKKLKAVDFEQNAALLREKLY